MKLLNPITISSVAFALFAGCSHRSVDVQPAGDSFLPLAVGNRWVYQTAGVDGLTMPESPRSDTVTVTGKMAQGRTTFFHLEATWPGFERNSLWVFRADDGNLHVTAHPGESSDTFLKFDAEVGQRWPINQELHGGCLTSLGLIDDYAVVTTPAGRFDGAREIGGGWVDCANFGWTIDFARGVGPVRWETVLNNRATNWVLIDADIHDDAEK